MSDGWWRQWWGDMVGERGMMTARQSPIDALGRGVNAFILCVWAGEAQAYR